MKAPEILRDRLRQMTRAGAFVGLTASMLPPYLAARNLTSKPKRDEVRDAWVSSWARALLRLFAIQVVVDGTIPPQGRGRLVVANHRSAIDIGILLGNFGGTMVSRSDLAAWPILGPAARAVGTVFVDRSNAESGAATIRSIQSRLEGGQTIHVFPEGTTFDGDDVRPFHGGAFVSALRAGAEILPVGLAYPKDSGAAFFQETFPAHLARLAKSGATRMVMSIGTPFVAERRAGERVRAADLVQRAHEEVSTLVARARVKCGP